MPTKNSDRRDLFRGALEMMILRSLVREPMHGYALVQFIKQRSNDLLQVEEGSLYPALQRMLVKGWVEAEWRQSENNRRARYYRLTRQGRTQLARELREFDRVMSAIARVIEAV